MATNRCKTAAGSTLKMLSTAIRRWPMSYAQHDMHPYATSLKPLAHNTNLSHFHAGCMVWQNQRSALYQSQMPVPCL
jgi:hypothetical protein